jgi:transposase
MKVVNSFKARAESSECPLCEYQNDGFIQDPRGLKVTCDECGETYLIASDAEPIIQ